MTKLHPLVTQIRAKHAAEQEQLNATGLSCSQLNFLALHVKRFVVAWQWVFRGATLRASSERRSIAICRAELDDLISRGLMVKGLGAADVHPTSDGKALIA